MTITTSLDGLNAVITGASRGLGREMALSLAAAGAHVIGTGRDTAALASVDAAVTELVGPGRFTGRPLDITDSAAVEATAEAIFAEGPIDILINNAGVATVGPIRDTSDEDWARVLTTNLTGTFLVCRSFGARMLAGGSGCVLNIASDIGIRGETGWGAYAASKGGVIALSKTLAWEWAPTLRVNVLAPGAFPTDINRDLLSDPAVVDGLSGVTPLRRLGIPAEIGPITAFLVSPANEFMTGTVVPFDGGIRRS